MWWSAMYSLDVAWGYICMIGLLTLNPVVFIPELKRINILLDQFNHSCLSSGKGAFFFLFCIILCDWVSDLRMEIFNSRRKGVCILVLESILFYSLPSRSCMCVLRAQPALVVPGRHACCTVGSTSCEQGGGAPWHVSKAGATNWAFISKAFRLLLAVKHYKFKIFLFHFYSRYNQTCERRPHIGLSPKVLCLCPFDLNKI